MSGKRFPKIISIFSLVTVIATLLWFALPATICYAQGGYGIGITEIDTPIFPGFTSLTGYTSTAGVLEKDITASSADKFCQLTVNEGTKVLDKLGSPLTGIIIDKMEDPPALPANTNAIGLTYDIGPDGATFNPAITLTLAYNESDVPEGINEEALVIVTWDETANKWVELEGPYTIDPVANTISVQISHFTTFAILAHTRPANFAVSNLSVSPTEVESGKGVTVLLNASNTGDIAGSYELVLKINNIAAETKIINLAGGASVSVPFTTTQNAAGTYTANVNGLSGTFTVTAPPAPQTPANFTTSSLSISPAEVSPGESVTISLRLANTGDIAGSYEVTLKINNITIETKEITLAGGASQAVSFAATKDIASTYTVDVNGLSGTFTVKESPVLPPAINWWLIGGIIAGVVVIGLIIGLVIRQQRA